MEMLERVQTAIENIARVMDEHGDMEVDGRAKGEPYYSLSIAETYLKEAEQELEAQAVSPEEEEDEEEDTTFPYNALARMGVTSLVIEYSGHNDEGWINDVIAEGLPEGVELSPDLRETLTNTAYDLLERHHGGWEINEGSNGQILVDVQARKGTIHHGACREVYDYSDTEVQ